MLSYKQKTAYEMRISDWISDVCSSDLGQLTEGGQVALGEEMAERPPDLVPDVDLPLPQTLDQVVRREVDQLDFVGQLQHLVGQGLADTDAGYARHDVVQAFEMLDVERRVDVDSGGEQVLDVLPAFDVATALYVRMGKLVHDGELRLAVQQGVDI